MEVTDTSTLLYSSYAEQEVVMFQLFGHKNVSVLDGGLKKWLDDGFEVTTDEPEIEVHV